MGAPRRTACAGSISLGRSPASTTTSAAVAPASSSAGQARRQRVAGVAQPHDAAARRPATAHWPRRARRLGLVPQGGRGQLGHAEGIGGSPATARLKRSARSRTSPASGPCSSTAVIVGSGAREEALDRARRQLHGRLRCRWRCRRLRQIDGQPLADLVGEILGGALRARPAGRPRGVFVAQQVVAGPRSHRAGQHLGLALGDASDGSRPQISDVGPGRGRSPAARAAAAGRSRRKVDRQHVARVGSARRAD